MACLVALGFGEGGAAVWTSAGLRRVIRLLERCTSRLRTRHAPVVLGVERVRLDDSAEFWRFPYVLPAPGPRIR